MSPSLSTNERVRFWALQQNSHVHAVESQSCRTTKTFKGLELLSYKESLKDLGQFRKVQGPGRHGADFRNVYKHLMRGNEEEGARLFSLTGEEAMDTN